MSAFGMEVAIGMSSLVVAVYTGDQVDALTPIEGTSCATSSYSARAGISPIGLRFTAGAGTTWRIQVARDDSSLWNEPHAAWGQSFDRKPIGSWQRPANCPVATSITRRPC